MRIDLIIESRNVFTGVGDVARPAAIAVAGDRIVAVGSREDVRAFALEANAGGGAPEVHDFGDALVVRRDGRVACAVRRSRDHVRLA